MASFIVNTSYPNIIRIIELGRMRLTGNVACQMGHVRKAIILVKNLKERDHLEDEDIDGNIKLKWLRMRACGLESCGF